MSGELSQEQLRLILLKFIEGKTLSDIKLKDAREHVELLTGVKPEKKHIMDLLVSLSHGEEDDDDDDDDEEDEEEDADEDEDAEESDAEEGEEKGLSKSHLRKRFWLSEPLIELVGAQTGTLDDAIRAVKKHVREQDLASAEDSKEVYCDALLKNVFRRDKIDLSDVQSLLMEEFDNLSPAQELEETERVRTKSTGTRKQSRKKKKGSRSQARGGFGVESLAISPVLKEFLGGESLTRPQVVKAIWNYIRENNLQNPENRREIHCDEELYKIFRRNTINMFNMNKFLTVHIKTKEQAKAGEPFPLHLLDLPEDEFDAHRGPESKSKKRKREAKAAADLPKKKRGGFMQKVPLSSELAAFMGGRHEATRGEVVKELWNHIRANNLKNPENKQEIFCDDVLRRLLGQTVVTQFSINKFIQPHFLKRGTKQQQQQQQVQQEEMEDQGLVHHHHDMHHHETGEVLHDGVVEDDDVLHDGASHHHHLPQEV